MDQDDDYDRDDDVRRKRGSYRCSKCGMPKKGHTCVDNSDIHFSLPDSSDPTPPPPQSNSPKLPKGLKKSDDSRGSSSSPVAFTPPALLVSVPPPNMLPNVLLPPGYPTNPNHGMVPSMQATGPMFAASMPPEQPEGMDSPVDQFANSMAPSFASMPPMSMQGVSIPSHDQLFFENTKLRQENHQLKADLIAYEKLLISHNIPFMQSAMTDPTGTGVSQVALLQAHQPPMMGPGGGMAPQMNLGPRHGLRSSDGRSPENHHDDKQSIVDGVHSTILSPPKRQKLQDNLGDYLLYSPHGQLVNASQIPPQSLSPPGAFNGIAQGSFPLQLVTMPPTNPSGSAPGLY